MRKSARAATWDFNRPPRLAVDGNKDTNYFGGFCFGSSSSETMPWWRVDLGKTALVHSVSMTNAGGQVGRMTAFLSNFNIRIGFEDNAGVNPICRENVTNGEPITVNFICDSVMIGRFVFLEKQHYFLYICEIEVYGFYIN